MSYFDLSNKQAAGQRILAGFDGLEFNDSVKFLIDTLNVGGLILFKRNIESPDQVKALCDGVQHYAKICGQPSLFIAIDQEGGTVARLPLPFTQLPGASEISSVEDAAARARVTASELKQIGVNMNFAPVMDIAPKSIPSVMAKRSFGATPSRVSELGTAVIKNLQASKIMAVAKHFPGIGRTTLDSHLDRPIFSTSLMELESFDLLPFKAAISSEVSGVMLSHILYNRVDSAWPASLSPFIAGHLLRKELGYRGLVMTDDLDMGAIKKHYDLETIVHQVSKAQIDLVLICHEGPDIESAFRLFLKQREKGESLESFNACLDRIMTAKSKYL
ncbi:MAG: beta-N-acetylhexosaminidase [Proteobacteria bacterium]|nr:beta-N-acetylhexosaminidase [Pseudomonadota bacterium]MBU4470825.1 beta-N-acetylhexosaminidase [Pseudomonadota bacterium]MCG2750977.1 beta-N-acetylhexosaminidase [Desulfobacteraceae bacterium]